jgi:hypothetical protein
LGDRKVTCTDGHRDAGRRLFDDAHRVGGEHRSSHPLAPIASVAKVMTAYVLLKHHPPHADDSGRRCVVGRDDVVDTKARRRDGQLDIAVRASEREALMAILLPSGNDVVVLVTRQVSGTHGVDPPSISCAWRRWSPGTGRWRP